MGREELKPTASTRAPNGDFEDPEIAERMLRLRSTCYNKKSTHKEETR
ncbi:unnamed protein product [Brassica rapa]|uniref:Uncharacterized protein n=1 Tax=Brassica campestris TaxID=3711 RepID=A0A3P6ALL3_BRACM|nr:unnamed protein product [Brassica rapa]VDC88234.1 unnamed protein product [Brassica rapa]